MSILALFDGAPLDIDRIFDVRDHSPTGFEWGYGGSGPAQLALSILQEATDEETAVDLYQDLKVPGPENRKLQTMDETDIVSQYRTRAYCWRRW